REFEMAMDLIRHHEKVLKHKSDLALRSQATSLRNFIHTASSSNEALVKAYALASEASARTLGMRPFDVQLIGALALASGCVVEMQTGEGKTLTATLPAFYHALDGRGVHVHTFNDYL